MGECKLCTSVIQHKLANHVDPDITAGMFKAAFAIMYQFFMFSFLPGEDDKKPACTKVHAGFGALSVVL